MVSRGAVCILPWQMLQNNLPDDSIMVKLVSGAAYRMLPCEARVAADSMHGTQDYPVQQYLTCYSTRVHNSTPSSLARSILS